MKIKQRGMEGAIIRGYRKLARRGGVCVGAARVPVSRSPSSASVRLPGCYGRDRRLNGLAMGVMACRTGVAARIESDDRKCWCGSSRRGCAALRCWWFVFVIDQSIRPYPPHPTRTASSAMYMQTNRKQRTGSQTESRTKTRIRDNDQKE